MLPQSYLRPRRSVSLVCGSTALSLILFSIGWCRAALPAAAPLNVRIGPFTGSDVHLVRAVSETLLTDLAKSDHLALLDGRSGDASSPASPACTLVGSCLSYAGRVVINVRLLEGASGRTIPGAAESVDGPRSQVFMLVHTLSDRLAARIEKLVPSEGSAEPVRLAIKTPSSPAACGPGGQKTEPRAAYTSLIVDARGLGLERSMSPRIRRRDGSDVWRGEEAAADFVIEEGIVVYAHTVAEARTQARAGANPLILKAEGHHGGPFPSDPILSDEDAQQLLKYAAQDGFLKQFRVIFVIDR